MAKRGTTSELLRNPVAQSSAMPAVENDMRVDDQRRVLHGGAAEADVGDDEREFVAVAADGEHHAEVAERRIDDEADDPLDLRSRAGEEPRGEQELGEDEADEQPEGGRGKDAQRDAVHETVRQHHDEAEDRAERGADRSGAERVIADHQAHAGRESHEQRAEEIDRSNGRHGKSGESDIGTRAQAVPGEGHRHPALVLFDRSHDFRGRLRLFTNCRQPGSSARGVAKRKKLVSSRERGRPS